GKTSITEEVIVEEIQMPAGQAVDFGKCGVHGLRVEGTSSLEECFLVAEVTDVRTPSRNHDRIGHEIEVPLDQIPADGRNACQTACNRPIASRGFPRLVVF